MMERNDVLRAMFSSLQGSTESGVAIPSGGNVFHINAFSGASVNINVTAVEKLEQDLGATGFDNILQKLKAEKRRDA